jgi:ankyrin repeat protein
MLRKWLDDKREQEPLEGDIWDDLLECISCHNLKSIKMLFRHKDMNVDVNKVYHGYGAKGKTALHFACEIGNREIILLLLANKANVKAITYDGFTALHIAARFGHTTILEDLIRAGINVNAFANFRITPWYEASKNGHTDTADTLIKLGANPEIQPTETPEQSIRDNAHTFFKQHQQISGFAEDPFLYCLRHYNCAGVRELLDLQLADVNQCFGAQKKSALHMAAIGGNRNLILLLLEKGADITAVTQGLNALHVAAQFGHANILEDLVHAGINIDSVTDDGTTALFEAAACNKYAATEKLLELKADPTIQSRLSSFTACNIATKKKYVPIAKLLRSVMNYQQNFIQDIIYVLCLTEISTSIPGVSAEISFIRNLRAAISHQKNADQVFTIVRDHLKSPRFVELGAKLTSMKQSFIQLMKQYNADKLEASTPTNASKIASIR